MKSGNPCVLVWVNSSECPERDTHGYGYMKTGTGDSEALQNINCTELSSNNTNFCLVVNNFRRNSGLKFNDAQTTSFWHYKGSFILYIDPKTPILLKEMIKT